MSGRRVIRKKEKSGIEKAIDYCLIAAILSSGALLVSIIAYIVVNIWFEILSYF